jgi:hypothetical protein
MVRIALIVETNEETRIEDGGIHLVLLVTQDVTTVDLASPEQNRFRSRASTLFVALILNPLLFFRAGFAGLRCYNKRGW